MLSSAIIITPPRNLLHFLQLAVALFTTGMSSFNVYRQKKSTMKKNTTLILILIATILVILFLGSTLLTTLSSLNGQNAGASDCLVSFGRYNGHTYKSEDTVGEGKCLVQSKWMQVMQVSIE